MPSVEVLNESTGEVLASVTGASLKAVFTLINRTAAEHLEPAQSGIFWLDVSLPEGARLPLAQRRAHAQQFNESAR